MAYNMDMKAGFRASISGCLLRAADRAVKRGCDTCPPGAMLGRKAGIGCYGGYSDVSLDDEKYYIVGSLQRRTSVYNERGKEWSDGGNT